MGTNYYWKPGPQCPHCGHEPKKLHIGKLSKGWLFCMQSHNDRGIGTLSDWIERWQEEGSEILDEYNRTINPRDLLWEIVVKAQGGGKRTMSHEDSRHTRKLSKVVEYDVCEREFS